MLEIGSPFCYNQCLMMFYHIRNVRTPNQLSNKWILRDLIIIIISNKGMKVFNRLCEFIAIKQDRDLTEIKFHYSKLLSSTLQRQNSRAILSRLP